MKEVLSTGHTASILTRQLISVAWLKEKFEKTDWHDEAMRSRGSGQKLFRCEFQDPLPPAFLRLKIAVVSQIVLLYRYDSFDELP
jgi:hypothetical protein